MDKFLIGTLQWHRGIALCCGRLLFGLCRKCLVHLGRSILLLRCQCVVEPTTRRTFAHLATQQWPRRYLLRASRIECISGTARLCGCRSPNFSARHRRKLSLYLSVGFGRYDGGGFGSVRNTFVAADSRSPYPLRNIHLVILLTHAKLDSNPRISRDSLR